jgi:hypothetical protein
LNSVGVACALAFGCTSLAASCGETNIQAIERLRPMGSSVRARLAEIAAVLPPPGREHRATPKGHFNPPFVLDFQKQEYTADVMMEPELRNPEHDAGFDLMLSPHLLSCLLWTGPKNPLDQSVWDDRGDLGQECEAAFRVRYLVVVRPAVVDIPERVLLQVFVVDLHAGELRARFPIALRGSYQREDIGRGRFASEAERQLSSDAFVVARCELGQRLARMPGARVDLREKYALVETCQRVPKTFRVVDEQLQVPSEDVP